MQDPELDLDDLTDSIASIRLGLREVPAAAVAQAGFVKAEAPAATERREQNRPATWQHKKQLSRQADASAKAWSEFKAAGTGSTGGGVFGSKVSFQVGAKKSTSSRQKTHTHTAAVVHGAASAEPPKAAAVHGAASAVPHEAVTSRTWSDFRQPTLGGWDTTGVGPCLEVVQTGVASLVPGTQLRVPSAALVNGAGFVVIGRKAPGNSATSTTTTHCIVLKDREVSSTHAQLGVSADGSLWLTDAGSKGGTLLNGRRLSASREWSQPVALATGDVVQIGGTKLSAVVPVGYAQQRYPELQPEPEPEPERESQPDPDRELQPQPELAVLDTCVLLDERELTALTRLVGWNSSGNISHGTSHNSGHPARSLRLVLPMVVLQELDGLKKNADEGLARRARRAVSFVHDAFAARAPWMIGQR
eukprot:COSAG03_NODE_365_length_8535_cov_3.347677_2_plen_418_part_00